MFNVTSKFSINIKSIYFLNLKSEADMKKNNITKTFSIVFIITLVVKILGLLRDIVFANYYGTGYVATAFFAAINVFKQL